MISQCLVDLVYRYLCDQSVFAFSLDVTAIACGSSHVVAVGSKGEVFSWGQGADGRLGLGTDDSQ